jgi:hypothetical protein
MNPKDENEQWRNRILRALAELRTADDRILGTSGGDDSAPPSESYGSGPATTRSAR